jgi:hypothetical protein
MTLNIAALAPVPSAIMSTATAVNPGVRVIDRAASLTSCVSASMIPSPRLSVDDEDPRKVGV